MQRGSARIWASAISAVCASVLGCTIAAHANAADSEFAFHQPFVANVLDAETIPSGVISTLAFEANGLLWIGTQNGLIRYDGYTASTFTHETRDTHSLAGDYIRCLALDSAQHLWVGTQSDGVSVIDTRSQADHQPPP